MVPFDEEDADPTAREMERDARTHASATDDDRLRAAGYFGRAHGPSNARVYIEIARPQAESIPNHRGKTRQNH